MIKLLLSFVAIATIRALNLEQPKVLNNVRPPIRIPSNFKIVMTPYYTDSNSTQDLNFTWYLDSKNNRMAAFQYI